MNLKNLPLTSLYRPLNQLCVSMLMLVFSLPLPGIGQSLQELQEKAAEQLEIGNYAKAAKLYDKMIKLRPDSAALYGLKGNCLCWGGGRDESFETYAQGFALEPENPGLFLQRGTCFHEYQLLDNAVQDFTDGLKYATTDTLKRALYFNRAASKASYMDVRGALEDNLSALKYDSADAGIHNNIGITYGDLKQFDKAEYHLKKVLELDSTFEGGLMNLGFMYSEMESYEKALPVLDMAVKAFPDQPFPYNNRGWVKHKLGNSKDGIKDVEASLKLFSGNSYAYRNLALIHHSMNNNALACENATKALQLNYSTNYGDEMELFYKNHCTQ